MNIHSRLYRLDPTPFEKGVVTSALYSTRQRELQFCKKKYIKIKARTIKYNCYNTIFYFFSQKISWRLII